MQHEFDVRSIVLDEKLELDVPKDRALKLKSKPGSDPKIAEANGRRTYTWTSSHLQSEADEKRDEKNNVKKQKKKKHEDSEEPDVQMSSFASWEELGRWYAGLEKERRQPSSEVKAKADDLTKALSNELDKTEALYDYV